MPKTILIVEDDAEFLERLSGFLNSAGYRVLQANDGKAGMAILEKHHEDIDVAVIDLVLPEVDGFQIIGAIARRPTLMKVIATTGLLRDHFLEVCKYMGAHAVLKKPEKTTAFSDTEWPETIEAVVRAESELDGARK